MSRAHDKAAEEAPPAPEPAGKVEFDGRGNSVWRWARDVLESTSALLKRLENQDLALEPTEKVPVIGAAGAGRAGAKAGPAKRAESDPAARPRHPALQRARRDRGGGFDPYNSR
jgi:hypothetical protein